MNRIKKVLEKKGIKQTWLAKQLGKSFNMVNSYVQNRRQPSLKDLVSIAQILGVKIEELISVDQDSHVLAYLETSDKSQSLNEDTVVYAKTVKIPLIGNAACGAPIFAVENIEAYIPVSDTLIKPSNRYFILRASGDSMDDAGINDGDLVLIKQQQVANDKDLIVALIDEEATIKEFHRKQNLIILKPKSTNQKHQPIILTEDFRIQGVVETVIPI